jgi:hypothetical protein
MPSFLKIFILGLSALAAVPAVVEPDRRLAGYIAFVGQSDLRDSSGQRLLEPWQILQRDRENFHVEGAGQTGDEWDPYFDKPEMRDCIAMLLAEGSIEPEAEKRLMQGAGMVYVQLYGSQDKMSHIEVTLLR